jgi:hypothetical protein
MIINEQFVTLDSIVIAGGLQFWPGNQLIAERRKADPSPAAGS